jgi:hypothetical protein
VPLLITAAIVLGALLTSLGADVNVALPLILGSALWATWDARRVGARNFRTWLPSHPLALFVVLSLLWIVAFPAYLSLRERIRFGAAVPLPGVSTDTVRRLAMGV